MNNKIKNDSFIWGAQYYRYPTPGPEFWEKDFKLARNAGLKDFKFWVQWRAASTTRDQYCFEDIDQLMEFALKYELRITLNLIYDVAPFWLYKEHPDCLMETASGRKVKPRAYQARQIGGAPGPCYNHPEAQKARDEFTEATVKRYSTHPALYMWDAWNEPEQCTPLRKPEIDDLTCYCPHCKKEFILWLKEKYGKIRDLNNVWGRIYLSWDEVELPIESACFNDMIDWRLFMLDVLNKEAERRISTIKKFDRKTPVYLHTVPTLSGVFNQITCSDDYALADKCDVFGGTINGPPVQAVKALSAANGKICYNVESHLMVGCTGIHPKTLEPEKLRREFLSHIGLGLKGFMFWQFHAETLGLESPAWGLTDCDGMETPSLKATSDFIDKTAPFLTQITEYQPPKAETGIITTAANEIFQWCLGEMDNYRENIEAYSNFLYWRNIPFAFIPASRITPDCLNAFTTIILPQSYYMSECETSAIIEWVKNGGMLICEADTAGYNASTGRHEGVLPGCGISEAFGIVQKEISLEKNKKRSTDLTSKKHIPDDVKKAWDGNFDNEMISLKTREEAAHFSGGFRLSYEIAADGEHSVIAYFRNNSAALIEKKIGKGSVIYAGTILGNAIGIEENETAKILGQKILDKISHSPSIKNSNGQFVRIDKIKDMKGDSIFIVISDTGIKNVQWEHSSSLKGLFSGIELKPEDKSIPLNIPENFADIFIENF